MKSQVRHTALLAAGALAGGAAAALGISSKAWFGAEKPVAAAVSSLAAASTDARSTDAASAVATAASLPPQAPVATLAGDMPDFRAIVRRYGPAVVGVTVSGTHRANEEERGQPQQPDQGEDPYLQFFRGLPGGDPRGRGNPQVPFRGQGSGFIVSADGLILTNAHVVRNAREVTVKLGDRREFAAKVLGSDPVTDVAVLRIDAKNLPTVQLGDPSRLEVGDRVLAIGAPYGLEQTATQGIVSAKGRSLPGDSVVPFIQTDAAVNPGNSGGPLFDSNGEVVGINAQIFSHTGGYQGLAFAIPINVALKVKDQIVATGKASHARLGVAAQDVNQALAESFGMPAPAGALVSSITRGSAAAAAGLQPGDVILEVAGRPIDSAGALSSAIGLSTPGERVKLKVWRERAARELDVRLGGTGESEQQATNGDPATRGARLGLALRPLTPQERSSSGVDSGMVVESATGPAASAGIEAGDVVLAIDGKPLQSVEQVRSLLQAKPKSVALLVQRGGEKIFVPVRPG
jgi:serine protease Do